MTMMIVKGSWTHKVYLWLHRDGVAKDNPSVCEYIGTVYVGGFFFCITLAVFGTLLSPVFAIAWIFEDSAWGKRYQARKKAKREAVKNLPTICPFGTVHFIERRNADRTDGVL